MEGAETERKRILHWIVYVVHSRRRKASQTTKGRRISTLEWEGSPGGEETSKFKKIKGDRQGLTEATETSCSERLQDTKLGKARQTVRKGARQPENTLLPLRNSVFVWKSMVHQFFFNSK